MSDPTIVTRYDARRDCWQLIEYQYGELLDTTNYPTFHAMILGLGDKWGELQPEPRPIQAVPKT